MFKSFNTNNFTLVDDDFEVKFDREQDFPLPWIIVAGKEYERRKLNVTKNLIMFSESFYAEPNLLSFIDRYTSRFPAFASKVREFFQPYMEEIKKLSLLS